MQLQNDRLIRALKRQSVDKTPIWIMRQAGRYLPEYRKVRAEVSGFIELCQTPELVCEVTLQPLRRFDLDAAILFSDILVIPQAMGMDLGFATGEGPVFSERLKNQQMIDALKQPIIEEELGYALQAIKLVQHELAGKVPLIGFVGSPWTLATYMVEGGSSKNFSKVKEMLYAAPEMLHHLLDKLATVAIDFLKAQIKAGVQAVQIFDSWGGVLTPRAYREFSLKYMQKIVTELGADEATKQVPIILFTKGGNLWLKDIADTGCHAVGVDWTINIADAREQLAAKAALQGNLDPNVLYASEERIHQSVARILAEYGEHNGHIFNLGHGIHPGIDPEKVRFLVDTVHELSEHYHQFI